MEAVQSGVVAVANIVLPGSGVAVNAAFELGKILVDVAQVLAGVKETTSALAGQQEIIQKQVQRLQRVIGSLEKVRNQQALSPGLQDAILEFRGEVQKYKQAVHRHARYTLLKQYFYRRSIDDAFAAAKKIGKEALELVTAECAIDGSRHHGAQELNVEADEPTKFIADFLENPDVIKELHEPALQVEMLAIIKKDRECNAGRKNHREDPVVRALEGKLLNFSTSAVRDQVRDLPDWFITEGMIDYDVTTKIGGGGDATIYKGVLEDTPVAIRFPRSSVRFVATVELWARVSFKSPYICGLKGAYHLSASPYYVMEYCDGGALDDVLRKCESERGQLALELLAQAARGIERIHRMGIVHGDIKCDNILITGNPRLAKVSDFDRSFDFRELTKGQRADRIKARDKGIHITEAVRFLAPECVEGMLPSPQSDVYSFGLTIYQALTGDSPYANVEDDEEVRQWKLDGDLPERDEEKISEGTWELITHCCHKSPGDRPSMGRVVEVLTDLAARRRELLHEDDHADNVNTEAEEATKRIVEVHVDATMGVEVAGAQPRVSLDSKLLPPDADGGYKTMVKSAYKRRRRISSRKMIAATGIVIIVAAAAGGLAVILKKKNPSSESTPMPTPSPSPTTSVPTTPSSTASAPVTTSPPVTTTAAPMTSPPAPTTTSPSATTTPEPTTTSPPATTPPEPTTSTPPTPTTTSATTAPEPTTTAPPAPTTTSPPATTTPAPTTTAPPAPTTAPPAPTTPTPLVAQVSTVMGYGSSYSTAFYGLSGIVVASDNYIYLSDESRIMRMLDGGSASAFSGSLTGDYVDGTRTSARYSAPRAMAMNSNGDLFICDFGNQVVRKLTGGSTVSTFSSFTSNDMRGIAVDTSGNVFVTSGGSRKVTKITSAGAYSTFWTTTATTTPMGMAVDSSGDLYMSDLYAVRKITSSGTATIIAGSTGTEMGFVNGVGSAARFNTPKALAIGSDGDLYVADTGNNCIRKIALSTQTVTTYAGVCQSTGSTDGAGTIAKFDSPRGIAAAANSVFYVTDGGNSAERVRKIYLG